ncbi:hypothetical protein B484DRAFT_51761 [Ochromonadaceae sp. CCMP2298]|nr:hypothetical protein B484DRAFT_51761 [Ochromonadaceae sp. CCMP2298]
MRASVPKRLSIFSGHDSVIAPVLSALGVYRYGGPLCTWPGYASRVVFELWMHRDGSKDGAKAVGEWEQYTGLHTVYPEMASSVSSPARASYAHSFVRVLYNGQDITQMVPECSAERLGGGRRAPTGVQAGLLAQVQAEGSSLCSLEALSLRVHALLQGSDTLAQACTPQ